MRNIISHSVVLEGQTTMYSIVTKEALNYIEVSIDGKELTEDEDYTIEEDQDVTIFFTSAVKMNSTLLINYELMEPKVPTYVPPVAPSNFQKIKISLNKYIKVLGAMFVKAPAMKN
jgi:hypothetical protein